MRTGIFNSGPANCKDGDCNNRICADADDGDRNCFKEFRAVQKAGSIEAIANSFTKPANGEAEVRLFNLSPDTKQASMSVDGNVTATNVAFTLGSDWSAMAPSTHQFEVTDSGTSASLTSFSQTPPVGASSVFLIGAQKATAPGLKPQTVFLVDNPSLSAPLKLDDGDGLGPRSLFRGARRSPPKSDHDERDVAPVPERADLLKSSDTSRIDPQQRPNADDRTHTCDVVIAGGSLASAAAAVAAGETSGTTRVCFLEITDWPGVRL